METFGVVLMIAFVALGVVQIALCAVAATGADGRAGRFVMGPRRRFRNVAVATYWSGIVIGCLNGPLSSLDSPVFTALGIGALAVAVAGLLLLAVP